MENDTEIVNSISNYVNNKNAESNSFIYQIYSDKDLLNDFIDYLSLSREDYLSKRLDKYSDLPLSTIKGVIPFIKNSFYTTSDLESIDLYSYNYVSTSPSLEGYSLNFVDKFTNTNIPGNAQLSTNSPQYTTTHNIYSDNKLIGKITLNYNCNLIKKSHEKFDDLFRYVLVLNSNGDLIYDSSNSLFGDISYINEIKNLNSNFTSDYKYHVTSSYLNSDMNIFIIFSSKDLLIYCIKSISWVIVITLFILLSSLILIYFFLSSYSRRTKIIMNGMAKLQTGDFSAKLPISNKFNDELNEISISFNTMSDNLNSYIKEVYLLQLKQKNAELLALQTQINPHFLYNTLESIRMKAISEGAPVVSKMTYILSTLFKNSVKRKTIITISEELNNCDLYLQLFKIRYPNKFSYSINIDDEIRKYGILNLIIQPLIENYIVHGLKFAKNDNFISINANIENNNIIFYIQDNGKGIDEEKLHCIRQYIYDSNNNTSNSIGLVNVNDRLKLYYGKEYGLTIDSNCNLGTKITITIPVQK